MFYYINQPYTFSFPTGLVKSESEALDQLIYRLRERTLVGVVININVYPFWLSQT